MLFVKVLFLILGSGTVVGGVTYSQITQDPGVKTVVVSNNHESKIRAAREAEMGNTLLTKKKERLTNRKKTQDTAVQTKEQELAQAKTDLINAHDALNDEKTTLNTLSQNITSKYTQLQTANDSLKAALIEVMKHDLDEEEKSLKLLFFNNKKSSLEKEKTALKTKINKLKTPSSTDICTGYTTWELTTGTKTPEETNIEQSIKNELTTLCTAYSATEAGIASNTASTDAQKTKTYTDAESSRDALVNGIREETQKYNLKIIDIKSKEFAVKSKLLSFQHKQRECQMTKKNQQTINNELEVIDEQITTQKPTKKPQT